MIDSEKWLMLDFTDAFAMARQKVPKIKSQILGAPPSDAALIADAIEVGDDVGFALHIS
jgi:hypothetical protein